MTKVIVIYASDYGNTKKMAEAIAEGAKSVSGTEVVVKEAESVVADDLLTSDGIIVGSPVHMGSPHWKIKKFIDTVCSRLWMSDSLLGRVGGVFATGGGFGSAGAGVELTMLSLLNNFAELGLVMIPFPKNTPNFASGGIQWGPYGRTQGVHMEQTGIQPEALEAAKKHGVHIARAAIKMKEHNIFQ